MRILLFAIVVYGVVALSETLVRVFIGSEGSTLRLVLDLAVSAEGVFGIVLFTGLLVRAFISSRHGLPVPRIRQVLTSLPYVRLLLADVIVAVAVALGLLAFVVPGLVVFTFLALAAPLIELERTTVLRSLRWSSRLVLHRFWLVGALVTAPALAGGAAVSVAIDTVRGTHPAFVFALTAVGNAVVELISALFAVEIAFRLIEEDTGRTPTRVDELLSGDWRVMLGEGGASPPPST